MTAEIHKPMTGPILKSPREKDAAYLILIRQCPCVICLTDQCIDAAHVRFGGEGKRATGMSERPSDKWTVPLCRRHHTSQHRGNEALWWESWGIDVLELCRALYAARGDLEAMQRIVRERR